MPLAETVTRALVSYSIRRVVPVRCPGAGSDPNAGSTGEGTLQVTEGADGGLFGHGVY